MRLDDDAVIPRYFIVAERDHEIQNPISEEKLVLLGERLGLGSESRVLDIASGRGGPALLLAREFGCSVRGIEIAPSSTRSQSSAPRRPGSRSWSRSARRRLRGEFEPEAYDAALCLGASFVWGGLADTVDALAPVVRPGGHVVGRRAVLAQAAAARGLRDRDVRDDARGRR